MAYEMRFYCPWAGDTSTVATRLRTGVLARYPDAVVRPSGDQRNICELDIEGPTGAALSVSADVDAARVATALAAIADAPARLSGTAMIATVIASGTDDALLTACATTFVTDFGATLWDEIEGFAATLS